MSDAIRSLLAPSGVLRAGINLSNPLLVTGRTGAGEPVGVSPGMAAALAGRLGVPVRYVTYAGPGLLADAAIRDEWDIGLIGAEPQRAETIAFTPAYAEIEATYLVPAGSAVASVAEVDRAGHRIAVSARSAYGLWLERNTRAATLAWAEGLDGAVQLFREQRLEVLAGLRPRLLDDLRGFPGARILEGRFMTVQQAIGVPRAKEAAVEFLRSFVEEAIAGGLVAGLIARHGVRGLAVAARER